MNPRILMFILISPGICLPATPGKVPENQITGQCAHDQKNDSNNPLAEDELANPKQRAIDQKTAHDPVKGVPGYITDFGKIRRKPGNRAPAINRGMNAAIKSQQLLL